jgi:UDP-2-acetamido-2,6-beta-L-arabino-hexul-4-ose reductase
MSHVALTGANGFLGWHTRCAAVEGELAVRPISLGAQYDSRSATESINGASRLVHLAGVNRGTDDEVRDGNARFAHQLADSILRASEPPRAVIFANSKQSVNGSIYGDAKAAASDALRDAAERVGATYQDVLLPNLFGEHGVPFYNAVTATFSHLIANGERPSVDNDKELTLLHAQDAADLLLGGADASHQSELEVQETVSEILRRLTAIDCAYRHGEIPDIASKFDRDLFNTFRSYTFARQTPIALTRHADDRGSFFEIVRSHGGRGQSSFSTTEPGISRGDHFHRRKIERFTVLSGEATIALRKLFTSEVFEFRVTGGEPAAVDMPTMWSHKITNTGTDVLYTSFWSNDIFDHDAPDTIAEAV